MGRSMLEHSFPLEKRKKPLDNSSSNYDISKDKPSFTHPPQSPHSDTNTHIASSGFMWVNFVFLALSQCVCVCVASV